MSERVSNDRARAALTAGMPDNPVREYAADLLDARRQRSDYALELGKEQTLRVIAEQRIEELERERDKARKLLREFLACGVEHDDPRMDYITIQVDRVTIAAARAAGAGGDE